MAFPAGAVCFISVTMGLPDGLRSSDSGPKTQMSEILTAAAYHVSDYSAVAVTRQPGEALTPM